jgi:hypothetical protein
MGELQKHRNPKTVQPNITFLSGSLTIGAAGAITAQTDTRNGGVTFTKNAATGRYDGVIHKAYRRAMKASADMVGPTAGTPPNAAKCAFMTGIPAAAFAGTAGFSTFTVQCTAADGSTATNPTSGDIVTWDLQVSDSP